MNRDLRVVCPDAKRHLLGWVRQRDAGATWEPQVGKVVELPWGSAPPSEAAVMAAINDVDESNDVALRLAGVILARCDCGNRDVSPIVIASALRRGDTVLRAMRPVRAARPTSG